MPEFASNWTRDADAPMGCGSAMANAAEAARQESAETIARLREALEAIKYELEGMGHSCGNSMRALTIAARALSPEGGG